MGPLAVYLARGLGAAASIALVVNYTWGPSLDFDVYWTAGRHFFARESIYSVARDGVRVFKYPPASILFFAPFALLPLLWAKALWGMIQAASIWGAIAWSRRAAARSDAGSSTIQPYFVAAAFWGLWHMNAYDGQLTPLLLCAGLWIASPGALTKPGRGIALLHALTLKIFTAFPLLGLLRRDRRMLSILACFALQSVALAWLIALWTREDGLGALIHEYVEAMRRGGETLGWDGVRGFYNQGFPALILRHLAVPADRVSADLIAVALIAPAVGWAWHRASRRLPFTHRWAGWIALTPAIHPLPFSYSFALAYPLAALAWTEAWRSGSRREMAGAAAGIAMIALMTSKTLGELGRALELLSIKSWGIALCAAVLVQVGRRRNEGRGTDLTTPLSAFRFIPAPAGNTRPGTIPPPALP